MPPYRSGPEVNGGLIQLDDGATTCQFATCHVRHDSPYTLTLPTVSEVLAIPELDRGEPELAAGASAAGNAVRWVHISELADIATLLAGGELLLTTGIALPTATRALEDYIESLSRAGVAGLVIELGRKFVELPTDLLNVADRVRLPVIALHREVRFVKVTEQAHALIINSQLDELRARQAIHERFSEMGLEGASALDIVRSAASMTHRPVLFANHAHQVLAYEVGDSAPDVVLQTWASISRQVPVSGKTEFVASSGGWLISPVGARGEIWGRLAMPVFGERSPDREWTILERAATALAMNRLAERDKETLELQSHRSLISDVISGSVTALDFETRAAALGVSTSGRHLIACIATGPSSGPGSSNRESQDRDTAQRIANAAREHRIQALVGVISPSKVGVLLSLTPGSDYRSVLEEFARAVHAIIDSHGDDPLMLSAGSVVETVRDVRRSFREAEQVSEAVEDPTRKPYFELPDIRLRGLLHLLRSDERVQAFCERELGRLLAMPERERKQLLPVLRVYLENGGNKSNTASRLRLSRPALYAKLARIQRTVGVDLESPESRLSLHVALIGLDTSHTFT